MTVSIEIEVTHLASLVLGNLVLGVLVAVLGLAERPAGFRNVDLEARRDKNQPSVLTRYDCCRSMFLCSSEKMLKSNR